MPDFKTALFVTWFKNAKYAHKGRTESAEMLRGCIGTFEPKKLSQILGRYALIAAQEDDRFNPIREKEISKLSVGLSLLTNFSKPLRDPLEWEVGKHGVTLELMHKGVLYESTFLPEVPLEEGWDQL